MNDYIIFADHKDISNYRGHVSHGEIRTAEAAGQSGRRFYRVEVVGTPYMMTEGFLKLLCKQLRIKAEPLHLHDVVQDMKTEDMKLTGREVVERTEDGIELQVTLPAEMADAFSPIAPAMLSEVL